MSITFNKPINYMFAIATCIVSQTVHAQTCKTDSIKETTPTSRFEILSNGSEVKDKRTGLIWQRCSLGQAWDGSTCTGTASNHNWSKALQQAQAVGNGYRLPNIIELQSIVEEACYSPAVNETIFPNTHSSTYWSASPNASDRYNAWDVNFGGDGTNYNNKNRSERVRAVRASQ